MDGIGSQNASVRLEAIRSAAETGLDAEFVFAQCLQSERNLKNLEACIDAIAELKCVGAVDALCNFLCDRKQEKNLRAKAAVALGKVGDPRARDFLKAVLQDKSYAVRVDAQAALEMLGA